MKLTPMSPTFRRRLLQFHTWTGLTMGLVIVFLAVTGAGFVLRPQLDRMVNRDLLVVPACESRLPLDELVGRAQRIHPADNVRAIELTQEADASTAVMFSNRDYVYVNPCTGAVLGTQNQYGGFFGTADSLHRFRFMKLGRQFAGWNNAAFVVLLIVGGIVLWWPRTWLVFKSAIKFNPRIRGTARTLSLHKVVGIYTCLVLLIISGTGIPIAFEPVRDVIYWMAGSPPDKAVSAPVHTGAKPMAIETLWQRSRSLVPDQEWVSIRYPATSNGAVEFEIRERNVPHEDAKSYVYLDPYTGETLTTLRYGTDVSLGRKIYLYMIALHSGLVGGLPYQLLLLLAALAIPVQAYSGISPWLRRKFGAPAVAPTFNVRVEKIRNEAADVKSFRLLPVGRPSLPRFAPGAHINVKCEEGVVRQYSLCNDPVGGDSHYVIAVKRIPDSRGGSEAMHDRVDEGDVLSISGPRNHFPIDASAKHHLLLAGGIGITPLLCMAHYLQRTGTSFALQYFTRSIEQTAFHDVLSQTEFRGKVTFHYAVEPDRLREYLRRLLRNRPDGAHLYICGPRPFMELVGEIAGPTWPPETVHIEYFTADPMSSAGPREAFDITLARSGGTFTIPREKSIAEVLAAQGLDNLTSCGQGVCGTCLTGVLEGIPDHRDAFLSEAERKRGDKMLVCVSRAKSKSLVLDL
jgi:vanillate O-demethylase ferredoxin subunit